MKLDCEIIFILINSLSRGKKSSKTQLVASESTLYSLVGE